MYAEMYAVHLHLFYLLSTSSCFFFFDLSNFISFLLPLCFPLSGRVALPEVRRHAGGGRRGVLGQSRRAVLAHGRTEARQAPLVFPPRWRGALGPGKLPWPAIGRKEKNLK